ncbi:MAG: hypothetical protein HRT88_01810 [Lentisphaeraceae bacterium]|nr:hypothetical protein [Lentisphaeraceae bacterium]
MKNFYKYSTLFLSLFIMASCSSNISPNLQKRIDLQEEHLELSSEKYEDYNDELTDLLEDQEYYYKKMLKAKIAYREVSQKISSRQKRIKAIQNPPKPKEGEAVKKANPQALVKHQEKLKEYEMDIKEVSIEVELYMEKSRTATARALQYRVNRDITYGSYLKAQTDLDKLYIKAEAQQKSK